MSTPNMSTTYPVALAESSTSFRASSSLHVAANPSPTASKWARGYRDLRIPRVRLVDCRILARIISQDQLDRLYNICGAQVLEEDLPG
jgi:hypothetical protein